MEVALPAHMAAQGYFHATFETTMMSRLSIILPLILLVGSVLVFGTTLLRAAFYAPDSTGPAPAVAASVVATSGSSSPPVRLLVPALGINAPVQDVGLNVIGNMRAPSNFTDVAWYMYGPAPGEQGSAVIDGHVDNGLGLDGVFKHLASMTVGDEIDVVTAAGKTLHFKVVDIEAYPYQSVPTSLIFGRTDAARLNLITCEGTWVPGGDTYDHRLVVFAELES